MTTTTRTWTRPIGQEKTTIVSWCVASFVVGKCGKLFRSNSYCPIGYDHDLSRKLFSFYVSTDIIGLATFYRWLRLNVFILYWLILCLTNSICMLWKVQSIKQLIGSIRYTIYRLCRPFIHCHQSTIETEVTTNSSNNRSNNNENLNLLKHWSIFKSFQSKNILIGRKQPVADVGRQLIAIRQCITRNIQRSILTGGKHTINVRAQSVLTPRFHHYIYISIVVSIVLSFLD